MTCGPRNSLIGITQTLSYGSGVNLISVVINRENFEVGKGEGLLSELGYARTPAQQYWRTTSRSTMGDTLIKGPSFYPPEVFEWQLQALADQQYWGLDAIFKLQQQNKGRILLLDQRWAISEPLPRTRAKIGPTLAPVFPGMAAYFAKFYVWIEEVTQRDYRSDGLHKLRFVASEMDKVALSEDI